MLAGRHDVSHALPSKINLNHVLEASSGFQNVVMEALSGSNVINACMLIIEFSGMAHVIQEKSREERQRIMLKS